MRFEKYRPGTLVFVILAIAAFFSVCFQIYYHSLNFVEHLSEIHNAILQFTIILFLASSFFFCKSWIEDDSAKTLSFHLKKIYLFSTFIWIFVLPELIYLHYQEAPFDPLYTQLYLFAEVFIFQYFLAYCIFRFKLIPGFKPNGILHLLFIIMLVLTGIGIFSNFYKDYVADWLRVIHMSAIAIIALILSFHLKWVTRVEAPERKKVIVRLLLISITQLFLVFHFFTEESRGFFNVLSLPTEYYLGIICFPVCFSIMSLLGNIFYLPIAKVLEQKDNEIQGLLKMSSFSGNMNSSDEIYNELLRQCVADTKATGGWILTSSTGGKKSLKTRNINIEKASRVSENILQRYQNIIASIGYYYQAGDKYSEDEQIAMGGYRSLLIFSIEAENENSTALFLVNEAADAFEEEHIEMLKSYVNQARIALKNQILISESEAVETVKKELVVAAQIHKSLIPNTFPNDASVEISAFIEPSRELGGDFYDYFELKNNRLAIVIGDVSGKGMPAALYMAEIKGIFQALTQFDLSPEDLIEKANHAISACFDRNHFVTLAYLIIDKNERKFSYVRAGHCPLLFHQSELNKVSFLEDKGIGLGILRNVVFATHIHIYEHAFNANDMLVLYTDGLVETEDRITRKTYDYGDLMKSLNRARKTTALAVKEQILEDFRDAIAHPENPDDLALIVIKFH